jgi:hypothetical protein
MIRIIFIFLLLFLANSCSSQNKSEIKDNEKSFNIKNNEFKAFINSFMIQELPFSIKCTKDYIRRDIFNPATSEHKANIYKSIEKKYYKYLFDEGSTNKNIDFRYAFKVLEQNNYIGVIYIKDSIDSEGFANPSWLILNIYNNEGEIINKLKLAGDEFDITDQFCEINKQREIVTVSYFFLTDTLNNEEYTYARKEKSEYLVTETGNIKRMASNVEKGYFKVDNTGCYERVK